MARDAPQPLEKTRLAMPRGLTAPSLNNPPDAGQGRMGASFFCPRAGKTIFFGGNRKKFDLLAEN
jgi:hypothetical protein